MKSLIEIMKIPFFVKFDRKGISFYVFFFLGSNYDKSIYFLKTNKQIGNTFYEW